MKDNTGATASQTYSITIVQPPSITSANAATFALGAAGTFTITTTGFPGGASMVISETGSLPSGVTFTNNHNGTATISGTPKSGTLGTYPLTLKAANGVSPNAVQLFTLYVKRQVNLKVSASATSVLIGQPLTLTAVVPGGTQPTPGGTVSFSASFKGGVPVPIPGCQNVVLGASVARCGYTPSSTNGPGPYTFTARYSGDANYAPASATTSVNVLAPTSVTVFAPTSPRRGSPLTMTAKVAPVPDGGTVTFAVHGPNGTVLPLPLTCIGVPLSAGTATCTFTPAQSANYVLIASYSGDALYAASTGSVTVRVGS